MRLSSDSIGFGNGVCQRILDNLRLCWYTQMNFGYRTFANFFRRAHGFFDGQEIGPLLFGRKKRGLPCGLANTGFNFYGAKAPRQMSRKGFDIFRQLCGQGHEMPSCCGLGLPNPKLRRKRKLKINHRHSLPENNLRVTHFNK